MVFFRICIILNFISITLNVTCNVQKNSHSYKNVRLTLNFMQTINKKVMQMACDPSKEDIIIIVHLILLIENITTALFILLHW